jgi:hypothetical protein
MKVRRPTAFEVSFPYEDEMEEEDEEGVNEVDEVQNSRQGKRKYDSPAGSDGRVRFTLVSFPFDTIYSGLGEV